MSTLFWLLLPDGALPLVVVVAGILVILGFRQVGIGLLLTILLLPILTPFVENVVAQLPPWIPLIVILIVGLSILRAILSVILGSRAADHAIGILSADAIRLAFVAFLFLPLRVVRRAAVVLLAAINRHGAAGT